MPGLVKGVVVGEEGRVLEEMVVKEAELEEVAEAVCGEEVRVDKKAKAAWWWVEKVGEEVRGEGTKKSEEGW